MWITLWISEKEVENKADYPAKSAGKAVETGAVDFGESIKKVWITDKANYG
jgi:hypothetical protein